MNYFNKQGHLTDEGVALISEALKHNSFAQLPKAVRVHMEQCTLCHGQAIELYSIIAPFDYEAPALPKGSTRMSRKYFFITAFIAVLLLTAFFYFMKITQQPKNDLPRRDTLEQEQQLQAPTKDAAPDTTNISPKPQKKRIYAANFVPAAELESLIGTIVRGEELEVLVPEIGQRFKQNDHILFEWKGKEGLSLQLIILNNQEENIFSVDISENNFLFKRNLLPGLYYWKLESPDDLVYIGKFLVPEE